MKKALSILILLVIVYALVTRFIQIDNPETAGSPSPFPCQIDENRPGPLYPCSLLAQLNQSYLKEIKPIFQNKCLMCHGMVNRVPLYTKIPPTSWLIERNQREAHEEANMTYDFPFRGEDNLGEIMEELIEVVDDNEMPPFIYKIMHWQSSLTDTEKTVVTTWAKNALNRLNQAVPPKSKSDHDHDHEH